MCFSSSNQDRATFSYQPGEASRFFIPKDHHETLAIGCDVVRRLYPTYGVRLGDPTSPGAATVGCRPPTVVVTSLTVSLDPGHKLAHYEILEPIGKGGMGEVYRALDGKLGRDVAIKVLPDELAQDEERLRRFQREAKVLASLNHPNIASIYGLEQSGETHYLVLELVPGETLAERIARGPLPLDEAVPLFIQIAEGLEAAHEKGIIHRDLKPANIKIGLDGKPKILDFGLAKAFAPVQDVSAETSQSPTLTKGTALGAIMGTAAYMSPEQARGKRVDMRTDIWSFACCLYEALSGKKPFPGDTTADIVGQIVSRDPDWSRLPGQLPWRVRDLLSHGLRKERNQRTQHIGDARIAIDDSRGQDPINTPIVAASREASVWRVALPWTLAVASLITLAAMWWSHRREPPRPTQRFAIQLPRSAVRPDQFSIAISPDGSKLVYPSGVPETLYVRAFDELEAVALPGTEGAQHPFFSPAGNWVGFFASGEIKKVPVGGGATETVCSAGANNFGASWTEHDVILFTSLRGLMSVPASGGSPRVILEPDYASRAQSFITWPTVLPDGVHVIYGDRSDRGASVMMLSLESGEQRVLVPDGFAPSFLSSHHVILYQQGNSLYAAAMDPETLAVVGDSVPILEGVEWQSLYNKSFTVSQEGTLAYVPGTGRGEGNHLVSVSRIGEKTVLSREPSSFRHPRISPDGSRIAVRIGGYGGEAHIWLHDLVRGTLTRLTFEGRNVTPVWTADGRRITYGMGRPSEGGVFWKPVNGSGVAERIFEKGRPTSWSPDGTVLALNDLDKDSDILLASNGEPEMFLATPFLEGGAMFSPDGRYIAYVSNESGRYEVYVRPYAGTGGMVQISTDGGSEVVWGRNNEIFYRNGRRLMAVAVATEPEFQAARPELLFEGPYALTLDPNRANYDASPDGQWFAMQESERDSELLELNVVLNWPVELERLVPAN